MANAFKPHAAANVSAVPSCQSVFGLRAVRICAAAAGCSAARWQVSPRLRVSAVREVTSSKTPRRCSSSSKSSNSCQQDCTPQSVQRKRLRLRMRPLLQSCGLT